MSGCVIWTHALHARKRTREQQENIRDHHQRVHDLQDIAHEARELTHGQGVCANHLAAHPQHERGCCVDCRLEYRQVELSGSKRLGSPLRKLTVYAAKHVALLRLAHVGLDGANGGQVFLHHAVHMVH